MERCRQQAASTIGRLLAGCLLLTACAILPVVALHSVKAVAVGRTPTSPEIQGSLVRPSLAATPQSQRRGAGPRHEKVVYLSFDDGPSARWTPQILAVLAHFHAHATFFVIGENASHYPKLVRAEAVAGDAVGNHTWDHRSVVGMSRARFDAEILKTKAAIKAALGALGRPAPCLRPPYGFTDALVTAYAHALGLRIVLWTIDPRDWSRPGTYAIMTTILTYVRPRSIVLLHDGGGNRSETVAALADTLAVLKARGYRFLSPC